MPGVGEAVLLLLLSSSNICEGIDPSPPYMIKQPPRDELLFQVKSRPDENAKPFIIECEAGGYPSPIHYWEKNGELIDLSDHDDRIIKQPGRGTFVITDPRPQDSGHYRCLAENQHGIASSNTVFVRESSLDNFKEEVPGTLTVREGNILQLHCEAPKGWPEPVIYWMIQYTNGALKHINSTRLTTGPEGSLWFSYVTKEDASDDFMFVCTASSHFRNEYKVGNRRFLQLNKEPQADRSPGNIAPQEQFLSSKNLIGYRGKRVKLWCIFGGNPVPEIRWRRTGRGLSHGFWSEGLTWPDYDRIKYENYGKTLVINKVDFDDEGEYTCEANNGVGIEKHHSVNLQVHATPYFTKEPSNQIAAESEDVVIECQAGGYPAHIIQWTHNGKPIRDSPLNARRSV